MGGDSSLQWYLHPPTPLWFTRYFLWFLPQRFQYDVLEFATFLIELSVMDCFFMNRQPSSVAAAALINAVRELADQETESTLVSCLRGFTGIDPCSAHVQECQERLKLLYSSLPGLEEDPVLRKQGTAGTSPVKVKSIPVAII